MYVTPTKDGGRGVNQTCLDTLLGGGKELIRFWWPSPYFQDHNRTDLMSNFDQNSIQARYILNRMMDSGQTLDNVSFLHKKVLIRFEPVDRFWSNLHG